MTYKINRSIRLICIYLIYQYKNKLHFKIDIFLENLVKIKIVLLIICYKYLAFIFVKIGSYIN